VKTAVQNKQKEDEKNPTQRAGLEQSGHYHHLIEN
jgi:hypothetical protein